MQMLNHLQELVVDLNQHWVQQCLGAKAEFKHKMELYLEASDDNNDAEHDEVVCEY